MKLKAHGIHEMKYATSPKEKQGRVRIWEVKNMHGRSLQPLQ